MSQENTYIRFDWAMKHMLRDKSNFGILEGFISVVIGKDVNIVEIIDYETNLDKDADKYNRVYIRECVKAIDKHGSEVAIELQILRQIHYLSRIFYGACDVRCHNEHKYLNTTKSYSIYVLYCDYGEGEDYLYHGHTQLIGLHTDKKLFVKDRVKDVMTSWLPKRMIPEYYLVRVNVYDKIPETPLDEWMTYLKTGKVKENTRAPRLQEVKKKLQYLSMSTKERRAYDAHMDTIMVQNDVLDTARDEGRVEGRAEGRAEGVAQVARK